MTRAHGFKAEDGLIEPNTSGNTIDTHRWSGAGTAARLSTSAFSRATHKHYPQRQPRVCQPRHQPGRWQ